LEGLLLYTGSRRFYPKITSDQPKGLLGLMSRAGDKDKGKGKVVEVELRRKEFRLGTVSIFWIWMG